MVVLPGVECCKINPEIDVFWRELQRLLQISEGASKITGTQFCNSFVAVEQCCRVLIGNLVLNILRLRVDVF